MHQALNVKTTKCLSIFLIICGVLMMIIQIAFTVIVDAGLYDAKDWYSGLYYANDLGSGIWCGLFIMFSGIIGCFAASKKSGALVRYRHVTCIMYAVVMNRRMNVRLTEVWKSV